MPTRLFDAKISGRPQRGGNVNGRSWQERLLVVLLRFGGVVTLSAFLAMFMPTSWMESTHRWLGLGEFPSDSISDYLTRSLSAMYGFHGGLLLLASTNVRRFRPIVTYIAVMNVVLGACLLVIDLHAGLPWWWTWGEGPPVASLGIIMLWLLRSVRDAG
jgi:hypothetical protein